MGASVAEVARTFEINPNVLHRGRREFRQGPGKVFPGPGKRRWGHDDERILINCVRQAASSTAAVPLLLQGTEIRVRRGGDNGFSTAALNACRSN